MLTIGIDPGASGGIAHQYDNGQPAVIAMPDTEGCIVDYLAELMLSNIPQLVGEPQQAATAYIEEVGGYIAGNRSPGSAMFNFGRNFGFLLGCLQSLRFRVVLVRPQKWQKTFSLGTKSQCTSGSEWKRKLKAKAQQLYPGIKVTNNTADALLILHYGLAEQ